MKIEICSGMPLRRWCFHLMNKVSWDLGAGLNAGEAVEYTRHIEFQHFKPPLVNIETFQYLLANISQVFSCCCNDREICGLEQAFGELETNATRRWRY